MADWADILQNAKIQGDFAGKSKSEQDAYFEFFAGTQHEAISLRSLKALARTLQAHINSGLPLSIAKVAFSDPAARK